MKKFLRMSFWIIFWLVFIAGFGWLWNKIEEDTAPVAQNATVVIITPNSTEPIITIIPGTVNITPSNQTGQNIITRPPPPPPPPAVTNTTTVITIDPPANVPPGAIPPPKFSLVYDPANSSTGIAGIAAWPNIKFTMHSALTMNNAVVLGWGVTNIKDRPVSFSIKFLINDQPAGSIDNLTLGPGETYRFQNQRFPIGTAAEVILRLVIVLQ